MSRGLGDVYKRQLLEDTSFVLVNPRYIEEYHYDKVVLQNGISLEISRAKRENTRLMYMRKLGK